jgi:beta-galactosidase
MKGIKIILACLIPFLLCTCSKSQTDQTEIRKVEKFTSEWKFTLGDAEGAWQKEFDDSQWEILDLPHDWSITEPYKPDNPGGHGTSFMIGGIGWYRKTFTIPEDDVDKRVEITFDGVYQNSTVWINGQKLGTRPFGYITFKYDLTHYLNEGGDNVIAVRVDNSDQPNSRWYSGSGIYRNVWLTITDKLYIDPWGLFISSPTVENKSATIRIESRINNYHDSADGIIVLTEIISPNGRKVGQVSSDFRIHARTFANLEQEIELADPVLWSVATPGLYTLRQTLLKDGEKIDDYQTTFGIRTFRFDPELGFFLNGEPMKIKGVCMHHDLGALGAAVNTRAMERQLQILREMGVNAIRTAHNPPAPELLHLCDRMGFLVMNETFDEWKLPKTLYGYSVFWDEWHERDLRDHILRDRNHPSVIMWSIGNEILEQWHPQGTEMAQKLASIVRELDPTRPITAGNNEPTPGNSLIKSGMLDLIGYNYKHETFKNFPGMFPGKSFIAAETTSALATRGSYDMPSDSIRRWPYRWDLKFTDGNADHTCSAYDNCSAPWGSTHAETWKEIKKHDFLSGMFIWTGFDYLGEPTPYEWPSRSSYFGVVDLAGFPKGCLLYVQKRMDR